MFGYILVPSAVTSAAKTFGALLRTGSGKQSCLGGKEGSWLR
jgi:hypothetical protein